MKDLYQAARHLVWLTQFGLSIAVPLVVSILIAVWLRQTFCPGGLGRGSGRFRWTVRCGERTGRPRCGPWTARPEKKKTSTKSRRCILISIEWADCPYGR